MDRKKNFLSLILLDALEDENESDINFILDRNKGNIDPSYVPQDRGIAPMHYVCGMENDKLAIQVARTFLEMGANPNCRAEDDITPMHVASIYGKVEIVRLLIKYGANVDVYDNEGKSPLSYAFGNSYIEVVILIRDRIFLDKYEKKKKTNSSLLSESKFEISLRSKQFSNQSTPQPRKENGETTKPQSHRSMCINKKLHQDNANVNTNELVENNGNLNLPRDQEKLTPKRIYYNYDVTSPYYINITHRRHKPQPKFPDLTSQQEKEVKEKPCTDLKSEQCTDDILTVSLQRATLLSSPEPEECSETVNIFSLTEENLRELTQRTDKSDKTRASLIEKWREKVLKSGPRFSEMRLEFNDVNEMVDVIMQNDYLNFNNTELKAEKPFKIAKDMELDSGCRPTISKSASVCSETEYLELPNESQTPEQVPRNTEERNTEKCEQQHRNEEVEEMKELSILLPEGPIEREISFQTVPEIQTESSAEKEEFNSSTNFIKSPKNNEYFIQLAEAYVHTDDENGLLFYETKLLSNAGNKMANIRKGLMPSHDLDSSATSQSTNITIPVDYESDTLRAELTIFGDPPGPITKTTKRLYLKKLMKYKRKTKEVEKLKDAQKDMQCPFSVELQKTLKTEESLLRIKDYLKYETQSMQYFANNQEKKQLREGHLKQSFIYMLIDPRKSCNLAGESVFLEKFEVWRRFLPSIFYVGKGKTSRPYSHLYDAMKTYSRLHDKELHEKLKTAGKKISIKKQDVNVDIFKSPPQKSSDSKKLDRILDIWGDGYGVVCLHVFHNIVPTEAYTREAAIIDALSLHHLTNCKRGDYYGPAKTWPMKEKKYLGIGLLFKAMHIYLAEGESQLSPGDLV